MKLNNMNQNNRTEKRLYLQKENILFAQFGLIQAEVVDMSEMGLRVKTDRTIPFKNGSELTVLIFGMKLPKAKLMWSKKDINNTTSLGLKFIAA